MDPIVEIENGLIRGVVQKHDEDFDYYAFRSIPFAEPPIGDLRFEDPVPKKAWKGVLDCTSFAPECFQFNFLTKQKVFNENCLHLNVYTRSINEPNAQNAVIVWIHGGEFTFGDANDTYLGPDYLIRKNVVLVTVNFRLGVIGFLDLEDEVAPGNQGLKDQVMALKWVKQNIRVFGGDPNNVTVGGTSAGATSAHYLALSPLAKGLIHKVISHGSSVYNAWAAVSNPRANAIKFCSLLGKSMSDSKEIVKYLKSVSTEQLLDAQERLRKSVDYFPFGPGVDSKSSNPFMPVHRFAAADEGTHLPYLIGYTSHEGILLLLGLSRKEFFEMCNLNFGRLFRFNTKETLQRYNLTEVQAFKLYFNDEKISENNLEKLIDLASDFYFVEGVHKLARVQVEKSTAPTYLFQFSYDSPTALSKAILPGVPSGASHIDDITYLFKMSFSELIGRRHFDKGTPDYQTMERMTEMWTNFAKYGKPIINTSELLPIDWQPLNDGTVLRYLNIDQDITMECTQHLDEKFTSARNIKV